jgi:predicted AAA+ superfamily ATPase
LKGGSSRSNAVYFVGDHSLLNAVIGTADEFSPEILENVLVHDLERRGYTVYTGKFDDRHIDFAAEQDDAFIFLQTISQKTDDETILEQKTESLVCLNDDERFATQKKYVIFLDVDDSFISETGANTGINYLSLQDFLLTE